MKEYQQVIEGLGFGRPLSELASGRFPIPIFGAEIPPYWYGFPPALIPIWSNASGPSYVGIWRDWFTDRPPTFVEMFIEGGLVREIARTPLQLLALIAARAIVEVDDVSPEVVEFANRFEVQNLEEISRVTLQTGDDPKGYHEISQFESNLPFTCVSAPDNYTGTYRGGSLASSRPDLALEFEYDVDELAGNPSLDQMFPWRNSNSSLPEWFDKFLHNGEIGEAWRVLNSRGWNISDARLAITRLAQSAKDEDFSRLAHAWLIVSDPRVGGY